MAESFSWSENLPDTSTWQPRDDPQERLTQLSFKRCHQVEERIQVRAHAEREDTITNFDHGPGVEDIFREELANILPRRYSVRAGWVDDRYGKTAGDCDLVVFNEVWFPSVRAGATEHSRRFRFPIEGVYAVFEIKSSLSFSSLDEAMAKLVSCHRLHRPTTPENRLSENRWVSGCPHGVGNPLYSVVIAAGLNPMIRFEDLVNRFFSIAKGLQRQEVVRALCVLGHGTVTWGLRNSEGEIKPALFDSDYEVPIFPVLNRHEKLGSSLFPLISDLLTSLQRMILSPEDLQTKYGLGTHGISAPKSPDVSLLPGHRPEVRDPEDPGEQWDQNRCDE